MISRWRASSASATCRRWAARIARARAERVAPTNQLTLPQEREIVADPRLLFVTWLVLNRMSFATSSARTASASARSLSCFIKLDRLKVIELQPGNRVRLLVSRRFSWRPGGPVQRYIHEKLLREFLSSAFIRAPEEFFFHGAMVSRRRARPAQARAAARRARVHGAHRA